MQASRLLRAGVWAVLAAFLSACGSLGAPSLDLDSLPALVVDSGKLLPAADVATASGVDPLLLVTPQMHDFVARYAPREMGPRARLLGLHEAVRGAGALGIGYNPVADGSAEQVFASGDANCLSFAHLFVALAREAGLDARYQ